MQSNITSLRSLHGDLEITKGYGVQATTIEGQNDFAPTLCFAKA